MEYCCLVTCVQLFAPPWTAAYQPAVEYYSAVKRKGFKSVVRWMNLEPVIQSEVRQKKKNKYRMLTHIYGI